MLGGGKGINFEIWEVLFRDMGGGWREHCLRRFGNLVVSVPDFESSVPSSNLGPCGDFRSGNVNHEKVREIRSTLRGGGGIRFAELVRQASSLANVFLYTIHAMHLGLLPTNYLLYKKLKQTASSK